MNGRRCISQFLAMVVLASAGGFGFCPGPVNGQEVPADSSSAHPAPVSFSREILPIFQAHCIGCHQPAKASGQFLMTQRQGLLAGGESGIPAIIPHDPANSQLLTLITPDAEKAAMPPVGEPLSSTKIGLIERWIAEGAVDDSPVSRPQFDRDHPPRYQRLPVTTGLAVSPNGKLLSVNGSSEVVLCNLADGTVVQRLIGRSPRIESLAFSPDGKRLAVSGGKQGEFGEIQIWSIDDFSLQQSIALTADTVGGVSWSPDGKLVAAGGTDNTVRAFDAQTGTQVLFQNVAEDWIRDTVFSRDGSHLVSAGRDMTCKLTDVATSRFVDNITSITPGVLKGGISSLARHPSRDEILIGSADGILKLYRIFRETKRVIGDDANLLRRFPPLPGRIHSVDFSADGRRLACVSGIDGRSELRIWAADFETTVPDEIKAINSKTVDSRSEDERKRLEEFVSRAVELIGQASFDGEALYATVFSASGESIFVGGTSGVVREIDCRNGSAVRELRLFELDAEPAEVVSANRTNPQLTEIETTGGKTREVPDSAPVRLVVSPDKVELNGLRDYCQLVIQQEWADGRRADVTAAAAVLPAAAEDAPCVSVNANRLVEALAAGAGGLQIQLGALTATVPVSVTVEGDATVDFVRDINPVLGRLGCNSGTCHGSQNGKRGFKLSLRGYDPLFDVRALTDDLAARRVNLAWPDESLMLLKATGQVPHQGGALFARDSKYYQMIRDWIADGALLHPDSARVAALEIQPSQPTLDDAGHLQQLRVVATYADGARRDVSREAFLESADLEVLTTDHAGRAVANRRGEAAVLARFEGAFAATTVTVMGERPGFVWNAPATFNHIDSLVTAKWERMKIVPSDLCTDQEFLRRIYLDLTGLPPSVQMVRDFQADPRPSAEKRSAIVESLIGSSEFVDYWTNKWADLLQVNQQLLAGEGANRFHGWIRDQIARNVPYDQFVRSLITSNGSTAESPAANYYKLLRSPEAAMENTTHLFLATRFNCNKCHDHPFESWTQDQYFQTAAWFAQVGRDPDPASEGRTIGGSAVENSVPLFEKISDLSQGEFTHERTRMIVQPVFPFPVAAAGGADEVAGEQAAPRTEPAKSRREQFADWLTSPHNRYFAASHANRLWSYLLGRGLIEPVDDIRASNPSTNPELLEFLAQELVASGFDSRHLLRLICNSRTYQLSVRSNPLNVDDKTNFSHALPRRLPAEVLFDSIYFVAGSQTQFPNLPPGTRAVQLPDASAAIPGGLLATLGRPVRESPCECERSSDLHLGSVLAMVSGPDQVQALQDPDNSIAGIVAGTDEFQKVVAELFVRFLAREATPEEIDVATASLKEIESDHERLKAVQESRASLVVPEHERLEKDRLERLAAAQADLDAFVAQTDATLVQREHEQAERLRNLESKLAAVESDLPAQLEAWRLEHVSSLQWHPVLAARIQQTNGAHTVQLADRSIVVRENKGRGTTELVVATDLSHVTAIRLEALADPELPGSGPGLANNGNFVLNELIAEVNSPDQPDQWTRLRLVRPLADFSQASFDVATLLDGNTGEQGWAVVPQTGKTHWATFQLETPLAVLPGSRLRFQLVQNYPGDDLHQLGRFRISLTPSARNPGLSLSEEMLALLMADPSGWTDDQRNQLMSFWRTGSSGMFELQRQLADASQAVPVDPGIAQRRAVVQQLSVPVPRDPVLVRLESDLERSSSQLQHQRLTAAQDLAWALANSPEFMFNH